MKLSARLAAAFVAFVVAGSLALVMWLRNEERRQSEERFLQLAKSNAYFIREANLPPTGRTAESLNALLGVQVQFYIPARDPKWIPGPNFILGYKLSSTEGEFFTPDVSPGLHIVRGFWEMAVAEVNEGVFLVMLRNPEGAAVGQSRTLAVLSVFWLFSLALAYALARGIVRPLRTLAARLPHISEEKDEPIPETARTDEIGQLARAYSDTRAQLAAEREARQQAERLAALGKMATGLAHEINNPVAAIKLHAQLLEEAGQHAGDLREEVGIRLPIILAESAKIESLVSQWMFLARPQPPQTAPCDFAEILAATIRTLTPAAQHADVQIINEVPPGCIVAADRRRLSQAITNVITNAIHAMAARGGTLTVEGRRSRVEGLPAFDPRPSTFDIAFRDSGPGFSAAALASATDLFFSEKEGGMGIGLNVAAGILNAHGGELRIANAPGGGAVVTFVLPAAS